MASPDDLLDAVRSDDAQHLVSSDPFLVGLGQLRPRGATGFGLAFPADGHLTGLGGPAAFNHAALEHGEAVVVLGAHCGLVPVRTGAAVVWEEHPANRRQVPDLGEADRGLRQQLVETTADLVRLEVAKWRPEVADEIMALPHVTRLESPVGVPEKCADLAARALACLAIVDLALEDDGGAISAHEINARRDALDPLEYAARRALVAAASPEAWPH